MPKASASKASKKFESQLASLEEIVVKLEGDLALDDALKAFEKGVELTASCQQILSEAEQKIEVLTEQMVADDDLDEWLEDEEDDDSDY